MKYRQSIRGAEGWKLYNENRLCATSGEGEEGTPGFLAVPFLSQTFLWRPNTTKGSSSSPNALSASPSRLPMDGRLPAARHSFAHRSRCLLMFAHRRAAHLRVPWARGGSRQQAPWQGFGRKRLWQPRGIRGWTQPGSSRTLG